MQPLMTVKHFFPVFLVRAWVHFQICLCDMGGYFAKNYSAMAARFIAGLGSGSQNVNQTGELN